MSGGPIEETLSDNRAHQIWETLTDEGTDLIDRYEATSDIDSLQEAIECLRKASSMSLQGVGDPAYTFSLLAEALLARFNEISDRANLDDAITVFETALELRPVGDPNRFASLTNLATALLSRFDEDGDRTDLDSTIVYNKGALDLTPIGHPDRPASLINLANSENVRFKHFGDPADLDNAIRNNKDALKLISPDHVLRSTILNNLAAVVLTRFEQAGERADLDEAITNHKAALELRGPGNPNRFASLNNLATALLTRFEQEGDRTDLDASIFNNHAALELTPVGHPKRVVILNSLANTLLARFRLAGDPVDLGNTIMYHQGALDLTPAGHPLRVTSLNNLAATLQARFLQVGDLVDLEHTIMNYRHAVELTPSGHPDRSLSLSNLATALMIRFKEAGDSADLDDAIISSNEAICLTPIGHPDRARNFNCLANTALARFVVSKDPEDVNDAIVLHRKALELRPSGHPDRYTSLINLAHSLTIRLEGVPIEQTRDITSLDVERASRAEILDLIQQATSVETGGPSNERLQAALSWVRFAVKWSEPSTLDAYRTSLELLDILLTSGRSLESRHLRLGSPDAQGTQTLAVDAAACAINLGHVELAVEMLEQGRSVLLTQAGKYRSRLDNLKAIKPALFNDFMLVSTKMDASVMGSGQRDASHTEDVVAIYQKLEADWKQLLKQIRDLNGFKSFLQPTPFHTLQTAAEEGPVIIVNLSEMRSDVVIVLPDCKPCLVPLPEVTPDAIAKLAERTNSTITEVDMKAILNTLWKIIVQPVVRVLKDDLRVKPGSRVWWCPTGAASYLPLHAAGNYTKQGQIFPDLFISSYTPTLSSLLRARANIPVDAAPSRILIIGQSQDETLPTVSAEIQEIRSLAPDATVLDGHLATTTSALTAMTHHSWIHLACHGNVDEMHPFRSHFSLYDGPLTLLAIASQNVQNAKLAFLSACRSAEGNRERPDEALHLTAGVQFAGFCSVVGTLWAVDGEDGPAMARTFYSNLLGSGERTTKSSAVALHRAVRELRNRRVPSRQWACFVHYGC